MATPVTVPSECVNPATIKVKNDTEATVTTYGICDET